MHLQSVVSCDSSNHTSYLRLGEKYLYEVSIVPIPRPLCRKRLDQSSVGGLSGTFHHESSFPRRPKHGGTGQRHSRCSVLLSFAPVFLKIGLSKFSSPKKSQSSSKTYLLVLVDLFKNARCRLQSLLRTTHCLKMKRCEVEGSITSRPSLRTVDQIPVY